METILKNLKSIMFVLDVSLLIAGYMYILKYYKLVDIQLLYSNVFFNVGSSKYKKFYIMVEESLVAIYIYITISYFLCMFNNIKKGVHVLNGFYLHDEVHV